jgi:hypothetical protein
MQCKEDCMIVRSAKDVSVGDAVEYFQRGKRRNPAPVPCTVVRITRTGLTVRMPDGSTTNKRIATPYKSSTWDRKTHVHYNFHRPDARERWLADRPKALSPLVDYARGFVSVVLTADDVRNHAATSMKLLALANWLAREVPQGVP